MTDPQENPNQVEEFDDELHALLEEMEEIVRSGLPGADTLIDRTAPGSLERQELLQDLMRGSFSAYPAESILALLRDLGGWAPYNTTGKNMVSMGDFLCDVDIAGESWPCGIFGAMATPFDDDPLLSCMMNHLRSQEKRACLLHIHPTFQPQVDRDGYVTRFVLFGGWLIDESACHPFCIEPGGTDNLVEQTRFFRTPRISRGFFRDRGHEGKHLDAVMNTQIAIDRVVEEQNKELFDGFSLDDHSSAPGALSKLDRSDYTVATDPNDWNFFVRRQVAEKIGEFQNFMRGQGSFEEN